MPFKTVMNPSSTARTVSTEAITKPASPETATVMVPPSRSTMNDPTADSTGFTPWNLSMMLCMCPRMLSKYGDIACMEFLNMPKWDLTAMTTAISATIAAMTRPQGDVTSPIIPPMVLNPVAAIFTSGIIFVNPVITFPVTTSTGPAAAAIPAHRITESTWASDRPLIRSIRPWAYSAAFLIYGSIRFPKAIAAPSTADFSMVICPFRLSSCVAACCAALPPASPSPDHSSCTLAAEEAVILLNAFIPLVVKMVFFNAFASSSLMVRRDPASSSTTVLKSLALPSALYAETPRRSRAAFASWVGEYRSAMARFRLVAAVCPVTFCSAIRRSARVMLSTVWL